MTAGGDVQDVYFLYDSKKIDGNIEEFTFIARAMQGFASDIREEGGRYAVVFIPMKLGVLHAFCTWPEGSDLGDPRIARSSMLARLGSACEAEGIPLLDLTPHLEAAASEGRLPYFAADTHLNALGHKIMADAVGPWITTLDQ